MLRESLQDIEEHGKKGDWAFLNEDRNMALLYGDDSFKDLVILPISATGDLTHWRWDGNRELPTLTPSILVSPREGFANGWHGFLTAGKIVDA